MIVGSANRERGSATAEFAVVVPAVCLFLAVCLSGLQVATRQMQIHDVAALAARSAGRGADSTVVVRQLAPGATVHSGRRGNLVCVRVEARSAPLARLFGFDTVAAESCALDGGG